jgi:hypothetical protein
MIDTPETPAELPPLSMELAVVVADRVRIKGLFLERAQMVRAES